jgi:hypothetical protein
MSIPMICTKQQQKEQQKVSNNNNLLFNVLYRGDLRTTRSLVLDSLDRLEDRAWPRDDLPSDDSHMLRAAFFVLLNKDMELKQLALVGKPPAFGPLHPRKAEAFFLALEAEVLRPFFSDRHRTKADLVDALKQLYLVS